MDNQISDHQEEAEEQRYLMQVELEFESKADLFSHRMRNVYLSNINVILDVKLASFSACLTVI